MTHKPAERPSPFDAAASARPLVEASTLGLGLKPIRARRVGGLSAVSRYNGQSRRIAQINRTVLADTTGVGVKFSRLRSPNLYDPIGPLSELPALGDVRAKHCVHTFVAASRCAGRSFCPSSIALSGGTSDRRAASGHGHFGSP